MPNAFPLSLFREVNDLLFISGQIGQKDGQLVSDGISEQTVQAIANISAILETRELTLESVVDVTAFLVEQDDYAPFNTAYAESFPEPYPTRATVTVKSLPLGAKVELKVIAKIH